VYWLFETRSRRRHKLRASRDPVAFALPGVVVTEMGNP
jgi:hypothetical protein